MAKGGHKVRPYVHYAVKYNNVGAGLVPALIRRWECMLKGRHKTGPYDGG